jgi:hypothetical protein
MNTVGAFPGGGSDDLRRKISELNPTIEATVEFRGRERAGAIVGLVYITGHSGRFVVDPHSTRRRHPPISIRRHKADTANDASHRGMKTPWFVRGYG